MLCLRNLESLDTGFLSRNAKAVLEQFRKLACKFARGGEELSKDDWVRRCQQRWFWLLFSNITVESLPINWRCRSGQLQTNSFQTLGRFNGAVRGWIVPTWACSGQKRGTDSIN